MSTWIGPTGDSSFDGTFGCCFDYQLTFTVTGNPAQASLFGRWATDDISDMYLNGNYTGNSNSLEFAVWTPFSITGGFIAGVNTLDFIVNNTGGGPTGLRVEFTPEPGTYVLIGAGIAGLALLRRRKA